MQISVEELSRNLPSLFRYHATRGSLETYFELALLVAESKYIDPIYFINLYNISVKLKRTVDIELIAVRFLNGEASHPLSTYAQLVVAHAHLRRGNYHAAAALTDPLKSWYHGLNYNINQQSHLLLKFPELAQAVSPRALTNPLVLANSSLGFHGRLTHGLCDFFDLAWVANELQAELVLPQHWIGRYLLEIDHPVDQLSLPMVDSYLGSACVPSFEFQEIAKLLNQDVNWDTVKAPRTRETLYRHTRGFALRRCLNDWAQLTLAPLIHHGARFIAVHIRLTDYEPLFGDFPWAMITEFLSDFGRPIYIASDDVPKVKERLPGVKFLTAIDLLGREAENLGWLLDFLAFTQATISVIPNRSQFALAPIMLAKPHIRRQVYEVDYQTESINLWAYPLGSSQ